MTGATHRSSSEGRLVVISGPSGAGKTSVCRELKQLPEIEFSISATTRPVRNRERDGVDYHFLSPDEFAARVERGEFLEWASYNDCCYGTLRAPMDAAVAAGRIFLLEIEVNGTKQLRQRGVPGLYLFIAPPDLGELRRRLVDRGTNTPEDIDARVLIAEREIEAAQEVVSGAPLYDHVILNEDLPATVRRIQELISP